MNKQKQIVDSMKADWQQYASEPTKVEVPEWNLTFYVYPMTIADEARLRRLDDEYPHHTKLTMVVARAKDENRKPVFNDLLVKEMAGYVRQEVLNRVIVEILKADKLVDEDDDDKEEAPPSQDEPDDN